MKFITIRYEGSAPYTDRTPLRNAWEPGEEKPVSERDAKQLLGYIEFKRVEDTAKNPAKEEAMAMAQLAQAEVLEREKKAAKLAEGEEIEIEQMDKSQLEAYARATFAVELDKRRSVDKLRNEVLSLAKGGR